MWRSTRKAKCLALAEIHSLEASLISSMILAVDFTSSLKTWRLRSHQMVQVTEIAKERAPFAARLLEVPTSSKKHTSRSSVVLQHVGFIAGQEHQELMFLQMARVVGHMNESTTNKLQLPLSDPHKVTTPLRTLTTENKLPLPPTYFNKVATQLRAVD